MSWVWWTLGGVVVAVILGVTWTVWAFWDLDDDDD